MSLQLQMIEGKIIDDNQMDYMVEADGKTYLVHKTQAETMQVGDSLTGFTYKDQQGNLRLSPTIPDVRPGHYGWGRVVSRMFGTGVFVEIGLYNKELAVSMDDLPEEVSQWPDADDQLYLSMTSDKKDRLWGVLANRDEMVPLFRRAPDRLFNQDIEFRTYHIMQVGAQCISKEGYEVFVHESEWQNPPRLGELLQGRVIDVHPDGRLNASLKPRTHEVIDEDAAMIEAMLKRTPSGFLPLHDKSDSETIKNKLNISKKQFKRAVGSLMKEGRIRQVKGEGIYLLK